MPSIFVAIDKCPECTARKRRDDNTAILPVWGAAAVEICLGGKRQKTGKVKCHWQSITLASDGSRVKGTG